MSDSRSSASARLSDDVLVPVAEILTAVQDEQWFTGLEKQGWQLGKHFALALEDHVTHGRITPYDTAARPLSHGQDNVYKNEAGTTCYAWGAVRDVFQSAVTRVEADAGLVAHFEDTAVNACRTRELPRIPSIGNAPA